MTEADRLEREKQRAIEKLYEDESLRDDLADDEVKLLLDWGMSRLEAFVPPAGTEAMAEPDQASPLIEEVNYLRGAIRAIGGLVGSGEQFTGDELLQALGPYLPQSSGWRAFFDVPERYRSAEQLVRDREQLTNQEMIRRLIVFVEKGGTE